MYLTIQREQCSPVRRAMNSRAFQFRLKPLAHIVVFARRRARTLSMCAKMPVFAAFFALCACALLPAQRIDDSILNAWTRNHSLPLAHLVDETLTIERAYSIQTRTVRKRLRGEPPIGVKAGLTSSAAQARFNAPGPIAGVLFPESRATSHVFRLSDARGLHIETEIAMRIGKPIERPLAGVEELQNHIDGIAAAIELPNLDYEPADQLTALDIVATNVAAYRFIVADFVAPAARDANELATS